MTTFRLVPTRRGVDGWRMSWEVEGSAFDAVTAARDYFAEERVPVLVRERSERGTLDQLVGVFADRKMRVTRR